MTNSNEPRYVNIPVRVVDCGTGTRHPFHVVLGRPEMTVCPGKGVGRLAPDATSTGPIVRAK